MVVKCFLIENTGKWGPWKDQCRSQIWRRVDSGEETDSLYDLVGAMYYADVDDQSFYSAGPDGRTLFVVTPGGVWNIDSRASNCTLPEEKEHRCWIRHGVPPNITVDKKGNTCQAGAGSIQMGKYHGFLINGELIAC